MIATLLLCVGVLSADPESMSADQIQAVLRAGIPKNPQPIKHTNTNVKPHPRHNRTWTVKELTARLGDPDHRKTLNGDLSENWQWKRDDGTVDAVFTIRGYGNPDDPKSLRLEIFSVGLSRVDTGKPKK
jgi:hypothetical protein